MALTPVPQRGLARGLPIASAGRPAGPAWRWRLSLLPYDVRRRRRADWPSTLAFAALLAAAVAGGALATVFATQGEAEAGRLAYLQAEVRLYQGRAAQATRLLAQALPAAPPSPAAAWPTIGAEVATALRLRPSGVSLRSLSLAGGQVTCTYTAPTWATGVAYALRLQGVWPGAALTAAQGGPPYVFVLSAAVGGGRP
ncbi:MAG: hypothetical protein K6V73_09890 [Firmicutes bacterium]|nr:hypothetical protein [Bacillota bacterium]